MPAAKPGTGVYAGKCHYCETPGTAIWLTGVSRATYAEMTGHRLRPVLLAAGARYVCTLTPYLINQILESVVEEGHPLTECEQFAYVERVMMMTELG